MSDFDRLVPGLCDAHRARIATIPLPDDRRHPDAEALHPDGGSVGVCSARDSGAALPLGRCVSVAAEHQLVWHRNLRVFRGGVWSYSDPSVARAAYRNRSDSTLRSGHVGFRCVSEGR